MCMHMLNYFDPCRNLEFGIHYCLFFMTFIVVFFFFFLILSPLILVRTCFDVLVDGELVLILSPLILVVMVFCTCYLLVAVAVIWGPFYALPFRTVATFVVPLTVFLARDS